MKRKKGGAKANGVPDVRMNSQNQVNGDAMEIDHNGHTHVTNSVRAESEAMASEPESPNVAEIPISTLSIGQSTEIQTEQPADLAPNTLFSCSVKDLDKHVTQTSWGVPEAPLLLAAGKSLLRLHVIQKNADANSSQPVHPLDLQLPLNNFSITAFCWNSHNEMTVSAQEELVNESGETMKTDKLLNVTDGGADTRVISSTAGLVTTLRWNASRRLLLAVSSDGQKGSVKIWKDSVDDQIPAWTAFTDTTIYDAIWTSESTFVICGDKIFQVYEIEETMKLQRSLNTHIQWEKIKQDPATNIVAALGIDGQTSYLGILEPGDPFNLKTQVYPDDYFTDLDFRPRHKTDVLGISYPTSPATSGSPLMLATCAASGFIRIWDANNPFQCLKRLSMADESSANNVSFSPDGALLAAAGPDAVTVWDLDKREVPLATWRAQDFGKGDWNPDVDGDFSLGWDPDGSRLSISLGNQVCRLLEVMLFVANHIQIAIIPVPR